jgi:hypothetical protein
MGIPSMAQDAPAEKKNLISFNPFGAAFGWYSGEYERVITPKFSLAISGSTVSIGSDEDEVTINGVHIAPRLYPNERAASGLWFGGQFGLRQIEENLEIIDTTRPLDELELETNTSDFIVVGFEIGFTYLFGVNRNYSLSVGAGVNKYFGDELEDVSGTLPTLRLVNLGLGF